MAKKSKAKPKFVPIPAMAMTFKEMMERAKLTAKPMTAEESAKLIEEARALGFTGLALTIPVEPPKESD